MRCFLASVVARAVSKRSQKGHKFVDLRHNAVLFGERRERNQHVFKSGAVNVGLTGLFFDMPSDPVWLENKVHSSRD